MALNVHSDTKTIVDRKFGASVCAGVTEKVRITESIIRNDHNGQ